MPVHPAIAAAQKYGANNYHPLDVMLTKGEGAWVWDNEGNKYLDFLSAYSAVNQGHRHPRIIRAMIEQAGKITLTSRAFHNEQLGPFLKRLCELTGFDRALPMNSGAEAVETAIKAARKWGYQTKGIPEGSAEIIVAADNFHGRTTTIISFSTEDQYRAGFGPFTPGFRVVPYGDSEALADAFTDRTVAFLVEPIQGEAGIKVPPIEYLANARALCDKHQALLLIDEIQTGFGRTGSLFDFQHSGIRPDGIMVGKALGGGVFPVSAFLASNDVMAVFNPGDHGSTWGGNPLACAVARAAIEVVVEERLPERAADLGPWFMDEMNGLENPKIKEIRGRGLLIGVELTPEAGPARPYVEKLRENGILAKDTHGSVIRLAPPLVITRDQLETAVEALRTVLS